MKRFVMLAGVVILLLMAAVLRFSLQHSAPRKIDVAKIVDAAAAFKHGLLAQGQPVPATVSLHDLMAKGLLKAEDVAGLAGREGMVSLTNSENNLEEVLIRLQMQDGSETVALADGSVQTVSRK